MARPRIARCGTLSGYRRHLRRREVPCEDCMEAMRSDSARWRRSRGVPARGPLHPCGTPAAYQRHLRRREVPDQACTDAAAANMRAHRAARPTT